MTKARSFTCLARDQDQLPVGTGRISVDCRRCDDRTHGSFKRLARPRGRFRNFRAADENRQIRRRQKVHAIISVDCDLFLRSPRLRSRRRYLSGRWHRTSQDVAREEITARLSSYIVRSSSVVESLEFLAWRRKMILANPTTDSSSSNSKHLTNI